MITFRKMKPSDIPAGLALCRAAGWNQMSRDWELFLTLSPDGCLVATDETKQVVGTVTTLRYQDHFGWVGMVLVDPNQRRRGIGTQLLQNAIDLLKTEKAIKLDATPAGREVYLKFNFADEYRISRMRIDEISAIKLPSSAARPITPQDFSLIFELDNSIFGADRRPVLEWIYQGAPQYAFFVEQNNKISGFCFGRPGHNFNQIGPVVATDVAMAIQLVAAALRNCKDKPTVLDMLHHSREWTDFISGLGFREQRPLIRMYRGSNTHAGIPEKQFAILGPEFG